MVSFVENSAMAGNCNMSKVHILYNIQSKTTKVESTRASGKGKQHQHVMRLIMMIQTKSNMGRIIPQELNALALKMQSNQALPLLFLPE